jgi:hypothetical protein
MAGTWWYYKGRVTTPIDIPGQGPTVIKRGDKFQCPFGPVANLKRQGLVVPCKPPRQAKVPIEPTEPPQVEEPKETDVKEDAVELPTVVASNTEPEGVAAVVEPPPNEATDEDIMSMESPPVEMEKEISEEKEKEKEKGTRSRRRKKK